MKIKRFRSKVWIWSLAFSFILCQIKAQPNVNIPATPEAATLNKFIHYPVSLNTGVPSINIPIYTIEVNGITLPIALNYHASGIKVNQQSTWVGLGWQLNLEPQINCSVKGKSDFVGYISNSQVGVWNDFASRHELYLNNMAKGLTDEEPDDYNYSILTGSGSFRARKTSSSTAEYVPIPLSPIRITRDPGWKIIDELGRTYIFGTGESTKSNLYKSDESFSSSAKCTQIISSSGKDTIEFSYNDPRTVERYSASERVEIHDDAYNAATGDHRATINNYTYGGGYGGSLEGTFPGYPYYVSGMPSWGGPGTYYLGVIEPSGIGFHYGYRFLGNDLETEANDILIKSQTGNRTVNEIKFRGGKVRIYSHPNHLFGSMIDSILVVNDKSQLIRKVQFYMRYVNPNNTSSVQNELSDYRFLLDSVIITGRGIEREKYAFHYMPHTYLGNTWDRGWSKFSDFWGFYNGATGNLFTTSSIPRVEGIEVHDYDAPTDIQTYYATIGTPDNGGSPAEVSTQALTLKSIIYPTGGKTEFEYENNRYEESGVLKLAGGLRVKLIKNYMSSDGISTASERIFKYGENESGAGDIKIKPGDATYSFEQHFETGANSSIDHRYYRLRTFINKSIDDIYFQNGSSVNYLTVTEYQKDNGTLTGKTVYRYAPFPDGSDILSYGNGTRIENTNLAKEIVEIEGGELLSTTKYVFKDNQFTWIERDSSCYTRYVQDEKIHVGKVFRKKVFGLDADFTAVGSLSDFRYIYYPQHVGVNLLTRQEKQSRSADFPDNIITQVSNLYYDNKTHLRPTRIETTLSDGSVKIQQSLYPLDYANGVDFIENMKSKNLVNYPVEKVEYLTKGENTDILGGVVNQYQSVGSGLLEKSFTLETASAIAGSTFKFSNRSIGVFPHTGTPASFAIDNHYKEKVHFKNYDSRANPLSVTTKDNLTASYQWQHTAKYPVAEVINAENTEGLSGGIKEFFFEGFEESSLSNIATGSAHTGSKYLNADYTTSFSKPNNRNYIIQWWNLSSGKWTMNTQVFTSNITLTGPVDDVRIFPKDALMTTYTYQPLVGVTSKTDASGKSVKYVYDGLGRLWIVKDDEGNILNRYCYNYYNEVENCEVVFRNEAMSKTLTRNNCGGGVPSEVTYNVPYGAYTSNIDQEDANQKAQDDIDQNAQNYANSQGACLAVATVKNNGLSGLIAGSVQFVNDQNQTFSGGLAGPQNSTQINLMPGYYTIKVALSPGATVPIVIDVNGTQQSLVSTTGGAVTIGNFYISGAFYVHGYATVYWNTPQSKPFTKACPAGQVGSSVTYSVNSNTYYSGISVADANAKAMVYINANGQNYANTNGTCLVPGVQVSNNCCTLTTAIMIAFKQGSTTVATMQFPTNQGYTTTNTGIPNGTYTISIMTAGPGTAKKFTLNGTSTQTGTTATFTGVAIGGVVTLSVSNP